MIAGRQTFVVTVRGSGFVVLENVGTGQSVAVESLAVIGEQIGRWLAPGATTAPDAPEPGDVEPALSDRPSVET